MKNKFLSFCFHATFLLLSFRCFSGFSQKQASQQKQYCIKNVSVIQMTSPDTVLSNITVIIKGNKIESFNASIPVDAIIIDGKGKWLVPGLIDMHVHTPTDFNTGSKLPAQEPDIVFNVQDIMTPFIANGVTTIFNLNANVESYCQRKAIENGDVIGPRIAVAALINGGTGSGRIANTPADGRQAVRDAKAEGYEFIKLYSQLNIETYDAIVDESYKQGLKTVGHIPNAFQGKIEKAFVPHFGMIAHAEELAKQSKNFSDEDANYIALLAKENGTWLTATLISMVWIASETRSLDSLRSSPALQYVHPLLQSKWLTDNNYSKDASPERIAYFDNTVKFNSKLIRSFKKAGVPILAGTDTGVSGVVAGFALQDELELLVEAGLTPEEALNSATHLAAAWLGLDSRIGTVEVGKLADLVLLNENPLNNIKNTRQIFGVFVNGQWLDETKLDLMLADLSRRNTASKNQFVWKNVMSKKSPIVNTIDKH